MPSPAAPRSSHAGRADIRPDATEELTALLRERILVIDGAMGTAIQRDRPSEEGYRGERFADWPSDLQGNNDLLTLTQPDIIATIHREYLDAGADIIETNTFNANAVSLADYGLEELAYELNFEAARLARRMADEATAQTPDKTRYVAGALGPTTRTASISPDVNDPGARNVSFDQLVAAYSVATNGLLDGGADLLVHRDHLRHPQRQGRHLRGRDRLRRTRPPLAGHRVGHHHRRERPHAVGPGHRGVLELDPPRRAAGRRAQLRARRQGDAALHRRDVARRRLVRLLLPQRRPAQRLRRVRRDARRDGRDHRRSSPRPATSTWSAAAAAPRPTTSRPSPEAVADKHVAQDPRARAGDAALGPRAVHGHRGQPVRQRRRAHQHHRLGALPQPDQGRRLRHGPDRGRAAGRQRRAGDRRQHGRGHDRRRRRDGPLPQAGRQRARHQPGAR